MWDAVIRNHPGSLSTSDPGGSCKVAPNDGNFQVGTCRKLCEKLCENGQITEAVDKLNLLVQRGCHIPNNLLYRVLKGCIAQKDLGLGRRVHALTVKRGYESDAFLANHLICMYSSHGSLVEAMQVFSKVSSPDTYMWASIILAYARHGQPTQAVELYRQMCYAQQGMGQQALSLYNRMQQEGITHPTSVTFVCLLQACASIGVAALQKGKQLHVQIQERGLQADVVVGASLVNMYAKCGSLEDAHRVFDTLSQKNAVTWNAMITGYVQQGMGQEALGLYTSMQQERSTAPNSVTFVCLLQACASVGVAALHQGKQLHVLVEEQGLQSDVVVGASLVNMYAKCGSLENAQRVFDTLSEKNVVTWTTMIAGYAQQGQCQKALTLYKSMREEGMTPPNSVTFACLLQACGSVAALNEGKQLHAQIEEQGLQADVVLGASLVDMYAKCGSLQDAERVFGRLFNKDVVTWTAMIAGYAQQGMGQEALSLYNSMQQEGIILPNGVTFACLLQACGNVAALPLGKQLHVQIEQRGLQADVVVGPSLVSMYAKCGCSEDAQRVFDSLPERDIVAWGALIAGYTRQGDSEVVFDLVRRMRQDGIEPNAITFLNVLTVCSHVGLVDKGREYFEVMSRDYDISPTIEHYTCMVDLLGRAGHLHEALVTVQSMPFNPDGAVWLTLLGACQKWSNVEIGRKAFENAVRLDENDAAAYVLMANIYTGAQMYEEAKQMQATRVKSGRWKEPGRSWWTDMDGVVYSFAVGDGQGGSSSG